MSQPKLSILIVTHNKPELCAQLALSIALAEDTPKVSELLVYQSGPSPSATGSTENAIKSSLSEFGQEDFFTRILVIEDQMNLGISYGFNALMELALGELLILLNDDMLIPRYGWFRPLEDILNVSEVGLACPQLVNGGKPYSLKPKNEQMLDNINDFSAGYRDLSKQPLQFIEAESNQPWLMRAGDIWKFAAQDPIINQQKFICNWSDPTGVGWAVDWACYAKIWAAGYKIGMVPSSIVYHYDHVTVRDMDRQSPGWTQLPMQRYQQLWGTSVKLAYGFPPTQKKFYLHNGEIIPYVQ